MKNFRWLLILFLASCQSNPTIGIVDAYKMALGQPKSAIYTRMGLPSKTLTLDKGDHWGPFRIPTASYSLAEYYLSWGGGIIYMHRSMRPIPPRTCRILFLFDDAGISRSFSLDNCPKRVRTPKPYPPLPPELRIKKLPDLPPYISGAKLPEK